MYAGWIGLVLIVFLLWWTWQSGYLDRKGQAQKLCRQGYFSIKNKADYEQARKLFEKSIHLKDNSRARQGLVKCCQKTGGPAQEQIKHAEIALLLDPEDPHNHNFLGMVYHRLGDYEKAMESFNAALKINPRFAPALDNAGYAAFYMERDREAEGYFRRAIGVDPSFADSHCGLGMVTARQGRKDEAVKAFNRAIAEDDMHADSYFERGILRVDGGDVRGALDDFGLAVKYNPRWVSPLMERGLIYYHTGKFNQAYHDFSDGIKYGGKTGGTRGKMSDVTGHLQVLAGISLYRSGKVEKGKKLMREGLKSLEKELSGTRTYDARGYALYLLSDSDKAEKFLDSPGEILHRHLVLSMIYRDRGEDKKARETLMNHREQFYPFWERDEADKLLKSLPSGGENKTP